MKVNFDKNHWNAKIDKYMSDFSTSNFVNRDNINKSVAACQTAINKMNEGIEKQQINKALYNFNFYIVWAQPNDAKTSLVILKTLMMRDFNQTSYLTKAQSEIALKRVVADCPPENVSSDSLSNSITNSSTSSAPSSITKDKSIANNLNQENVLNSDDSSLSDLSSDSSTSSASSSITKNDKSVANNLNYGLSSDDDSSLSDASTDSSTLSASSLITMNDKFVANKFNQEIEEINKLMVNFNVFNKTKVLEKISNCENLVINNKIKDKLSTFRFNVEWLHVKKAIESFAKLKDLIEQKIQ